jgi:hypothetical protein
MEQAWARLGMNPMMTVCMGLLTDPGCPPIRAGCSRHQAVELDKHRLSDCFVSASANARHETRMVHQVALRSL